MSNLLILHSTKTETMFVSSDVGGLVGGSGSSNHRSIIDVQKSRGGACICNTEC
jgi:hypothetical protein